MGLVFSLQVGIARYEIKQRIKAGIPVKDQILIKVPLKLEQTSNSTFVRKDKREFRYKGEMYDILQQEKRGDTTWYMCIHDAKESGLFKDLDKQVKDFLSSSPVHRRQRQFSLAFFYQQYLPFTEPGSDMFSNYEPQMFARIAPFLPEGVKSGLLRPPNGWFFT